MRALKHLLQYPAECCLPSGTLSMLRAVFPLSSRLTLNIIWADTYCLLQKTSACLFLYNAKLITIIRPVTRQPFACSTASCNWQTHSWVHNFCSPWFSKTVRNCSKITRSIETGGGAQLQECLLKYKYAKIQQEQKKKRRERGAAVKPSSKTTEQQQARE